MNTTRAIAQVLKHLSSYGVTHLPRVEIQPLSKTPSPKKTTGAPVRLETPDRNQETDPKAVVNRSSRTMTAATAASGVSKALQLQGTGEINTPAKQEATLKILGTQFENKAERITALCELASVVAQCRRCQELAVSRKQTVFGVGNPEATIMFIGEAPGADEDQQGEPFVGKAGQLLNKIIEACTLRREDIYICNVLRCRPPGNRTPSTQEAVNCREFLDAQIHIIRPKYIVCWGTVAAQNLLNETRAVGKLRGQFFDYHGARVLCTYHPSYLLRNPNAKKDVWEDMKFFMKDLGVDL